MGKAQTWLLPDAQGNPASMGHALNQEGCGKRPITKPAINYWPVLANEATREMPYHQTKIDGALQVHELTGINTLLRSTLHLYNQLIHRGVTTPMYVTVRANQFNQVPAAVYPAADFFEVPSSVPMMGAHGSNEHVLSKLIL
jgi:hypothetical protein